MNSSNSNSPISYMFVYVAHFEPLSISDICFKNKAYTSIVTDHVLPFMTTMYQSSDGHFHDNIPFHRAQIPDWFPKHNNGFIVLRWPLQPLDLNLAEHSRDMVEQEIVIMDVCPTNLCDAIMSIWWKISEECSSILLNLWYTEWRQL